MSEQSGITSSIDATIHAVSRDNSLCYNSLYHKEIINLNVYINMLFYDKLKPGILTHFTYDEYQLYIKSLKPV